MLEKANDLPLTPGVYLMEDRNGKVIYVGKSRKLRNRVSQYFRNGEKNAKTARMVSMVVDFRYYLCDTEIEALTLENTLIKQYTPKYNIRLKDAKSYPYIKITKEEYPRLVFTRTRRSDGGRYFGPYSGVSVAGSVLRNLQQTLHLPACKRQFPQDIGKGRPCLYYQMGRCCGLCTGHVEKETYDELIERAAQILRGNTAAVRRTLTAEMNEAAQAELFEKAATLRDTLRAVESLSQKQKVVADPQVSEDVIGFYHAENGGALVIFYVREGALIDRDEFFFGADDLLSEEEALTAFLFDHYRHRTEIPPKILLSFSLSPEESAPLCDSLSLSAGHRVQLYTPERGDGHTLCELAVSNAREKCRTAEAAREERDETLFRLAKLLALEVLPERIESYDISNFGAEHKTCGMIVWEKGKFKKSDYRTFRIRTVEGTDDYASMREALSRRFSHLSDEKGAFSLLPDLILLDGGKTHVAMAKELLGSLGIAVPVFGMVKDDFHKTRALCREDSEISIVKDEGVFRMIYAIQEEVHRYAVRQMSAAKGKTLRRSVLLEIPGIGKEKAKAILSHFGGLAPLRRATVEDLRKAPGIGDKRASEIYGALHPTEGDKES